MRVSTTVWASSNRFTAAIDTSVMPGNTLLSLLSQRVSWSRFPTVAGMGLAWISSSQPSSPRMTWRSSAPYTVCSGWPPWAATVLSGARAPQHNTSGPMMTRLRSFALAAAKRATRPPVITPRTNRPTTSSQGWRIITGFSAMRTVWRRLVGGNTGPPGTGVISRSTVTAASSARPLATQSSQTLTTHAVETRERTTRCLEDMEEPHDCPSRPDKFAVAIGRIGSQAFEGISFGIDRDEQRGRILIHMLLHQMFLDLIQG